MIFDSESDVHAAELFDATCRKENCHPDFVHSDNGEPMKGITLWDFREHKFCFRKSEYLLLIKFPM